MDGGGKEGQNKCFGHFYAASQSGVVFYRQNALQSPCTAWTFPGQAGAYGKKWPFPLFFSTEISPDHPVAEPLHK